MVANVAELNPGYLHRGTEGGNALAKLVATEALPSAFQHDALPLQRYDDLVGLLWAKLQLNLNNAINALANIPLQQQLQHRSYHLVLAAAMDELLAVAQQQAITLPKLTALPARWLPYVMRLPMALIHI